jgi:hypothetical protein
VPRIVPGVGLAALVAAAAAAVGSPMPALAFDKVDQLQPVQAGRGYVYYIREADVQKQPLAGRPVTVKVGKVPAPDAAVAPADAQGHATGPAGVTAVEQSGADGLAYFLLRTSSTPGDNEFTWSDTTWTGQVLVTGQPASAASPTVSAPAGASGSSGGAKGPTGGAGGAGATAKPKSPTPAQLAGRLPTAAVPPLAAGLAAMGLVWLTVPPYLARRRRYFWRTNERLVPADALPTV